MKYKLFGIAMFLGCLSGSALAAGISVDTVDHVYDGKLTIKKWAGVSDITVTVTNRLAGAVDSITWFGKEFVDSHDHGRQVQTALAFSPYGECYNPTEAGSAYDGTGMTSTSYLHDIFYLNTEKSALQTQTSMAFWYNPNGCSVSPALSPFIMHKGIRIGEVYHNNQSYYFPHAIKYDVTIQFPSQQLPSSIDGAGVEAILHYLNSEFNRKDHVYRYNPATQSYTKIGDCPSQTGTYLNCFQKDDWIDTAAFISEPVIIEHNTNPTYAAGFITDTPIGVTNGQWYRVTRYDASTGKMPDGVSILKMALFHNLQRPSLSAWNGKAFSYRTYIIIGSVDNVKTTMRQMYNLWTQ